MIEQNLKFLIIINTKNPSRRNPIKKKQYPNTNLIIQITYKYS